MDYSRWMSLDTKIHDKKLANICLPMTHDTGTFDLSDILAPDPTWLPVLEEALGELVKALNDAGILPYGMDPLAWLLQEALPALKGLTTATKKTVAEQLQGGIRGFDFRMYNKEGVYYTYHGLQSTSTFESMLDDIRSFMSATTRVNEQVGEIVYVNLSHYLSFAGGDYVAFGNFVKSKLSAYAYKNYGTNDPFNQTYKQIIGQDGRNCSRVILVSQADLGDPTYFWPDEYCPPDENRNMSVLYGKYTDSTDLDHVIDTQVSQFRTAVAEGVPFVNYMTMTPDTAQYVNIIVSSLYGAFRTLASDLRLANLDALADIVDAIAAAMLADVEATNLLGWRTLEELESRINRQMPELVDDNFVPYTGDINQITMIFCDFWENSEVVDLAIALGDDFEMEWTGNTVIQHSGGNLGSTEGPTAAMFQEKLHMVYKDKNNSEMWMAIYDPASDSWISNQLVKEMSGGSLLNATTNKSPAAAVFDEQLYVVWKSAGSDSIQCAQWNGLTWSGGAAITIASPGQNPQTNNSPYLATYKGTLFLVHKYRNNDDIHCATLNSTNFTWSGGTKIAVGNNEDHPNPRTNVRPALVEYGGLLYLMYKGGGSNELYQSTWNGSSWSGNVKIKNDDADYDPKSNEGPALSRFGGDIYMPYKGESDNIWLSYYNGSSWNGNIELEKHTSIAPKTDRGPWAVRIGLELFLLNQGDNDDLYQSVLKPVAL